LKKLDLGQTFHILANVGVIGGILLLAYELRQNNLYLQEQTRYNAFQNRLSANQLSAENSEIARFWHWQEGDEPLSDLERRRLEDFVHTYLLRWQYDYQSLQLGTVAADDFPALAIRLTWDRRPVFSEVWEVRKRGYSPDFVKWVEEDIIGR